MTHSVTHSGVHFINVLRAAFSPADPESAKKTDNFPVFSVLLGSVCIKAARRTLMILTPGRGLWSYRIQSLYGNLFFGLLRDYGLQGVKLFN